MIHEPLLAVGGGLAPCRYGSSRLLFRGPPKDIDGRHLAFVGGSETVARGAERPYPALLEDALGEACVNFGQANGSVEAFLHDSFVPHACAGAALTVVAAMGASNLSNRLYSVHPRRNDRFLRASAQLRALYPEVDFAEICFTRHLLLRLHEASPERFATVRQELRAAWLARMRTFLDRIGPRVVLAWVAAEPPPREGEERGREERDGPLGPEPLFVTRRMVEALRPLVRAVVVAPPAPQGETAEDAQARAAAALAGPLRALLPDAEARGTQASA